MNGIGLLLVLIGVVAAAMFVVTFRTHSRHPSPEAQRLAKMGRVLDAARAAEPDPESTDGSAAGEGAQPS